jgi:predicted polyphosphate/ATP-dependent NAD kinase
MTEIIEQWDMHPMAYDGQLKPLNAMIDVGLHSREAFENLVGLIERKRKLVPDIKRADYQRDLMRERRARYAKAIELHELTHRTKASPVERRALEESFRKRWAAARAEFIGAKGQLSWKQRNAASGEFWQMIDEKLDQNLREARRVRG